MNVNERSSQVFSGVFLIGLAVLFLTGWWWPGVMFVIAGATIARTVSEGREWTSDRNALVALGIGVVFLVMNTFGGLLRSDILLPLILIGIGGYMLFGKNIQSQMGSSAKPKNDDTV